MEKILESFTKEQINKISIFSELIENLELSSIYKNAGILFFALKNGKLTNDYIKENFKEEFRIIEILLQLESINYEQQETEAENIRKMFFAITKEIRVIMLKIASAVTELRTIDETKDNSALAKSILYLFAPLSARLGLAHIKSELEDGAFKILYPEEFSKIRQELDKRYVARQPIVDSLTELVTKSMQELNISGRVFGRKKHIYSIYKKLKEHDFDHIYDLVAVRAIVNTVDDCYTLLGKLHGQLEPLQHRFKDYIAIPKSNGYQSLHTTVIFEGLPVEIQIRTEEMHKFNEYGVAAHWIFKEKRKQTKFDERLSSIRQMMEDENSSLDEIAESLNSDIYSEEIFVQTPKGKVIYLPTGATAIDFAYAIHSEVGNKCVGAKVNNKMISTSAPLRNGDIVEIITNPASKGPSRDWLKIVKTSGAKAKINAFFNKNMKDENIKTGKTMLENAIKDKGFAVNKILNSKNLTDVLDYYNFTEEDELFANIGTNAISAKYTANKLIQNHNKSLKNETVEFKPNLPVTLHAPSEKNVDIKGLNNILMKFAGCCQPMYGDDIIGFVSAGRGVIIHRSVCPNVNYFNPDRLIEASWKEIKEKPKKK
ncbi:MAG: bifunctional (p)ppGpp synthetase/guanosine-3',5'-bis(diphosphate) 3'-pyrophosphohydrolase [Clostridiales bacterium]|nr:bifunctional (p)ppGpp synthetase/guanosine-3',5'-bis(diphosphate) 3'-pyrophosphohydrolase [Clostridiales bacterium]